MFWTDRALLLTARGLENLASAIDRHRIVTILAFAAVFLSICAFFAATKMMWYDEMATYYPAKMPDIGEMMKLFSSGLDSQSPVTSLVLRASIRAIGDGPVADRMPFAFGCLIICAGIFFF